MAETTLGNAVEVLSSFGFFDVILPFLLVFTITFGVLEKVKFFGADKKNLNAMLAFTVAFLVVAATQITTAIQLSVPKVAFVLVILISFLLLVASMMKPGDFDFLGQFGELKWSWVAVIAVAIVGIFLSSVGWLEPIIDFFNTNLGGPVLSTLVFVVVMIAVLFWLTWEKKNTTGRSGGTS
ncbi:MAG: hypothetical protein Q8R00_03745 [Candidatus Nanoarchaeia archaeon]|nr:hypothetical protein [Candidatus Nanoarchaeia archaeon]